MPSSVPGMQPSVECTVVFARLPGRLVAFAAACALIGLGVLPAEHIHQAPADGHHAAVVHRHLAAHQTHARGTAVERADGDGQAHWLTVAFTSGTTSPETAAAVALLDSAGFPRPLETFNVLPLAPMSAHDPPWVPSSGLRGPPMLVL